MLYMIYVWAIKYQYWIYQYYIIYVNWVLWGQIFPSSPLQKNIRCSWIKLVKYQMSISNLARKHGNPEIRWCMVSLLLYDWYWQEFSTGGFLACYTKLLCISLFLYISMAYISSLVIDKWSAHQNIFFSQYSMIFMSSIVINKTSAHQYILFNIWWRIFQV